MNFLSSLTGKRLERINCRLLSLIFILNLFLSSNLFAEPNKLIIYSVNYPLQYFAQRIGGDYVEVKFPAPNDEDPAFWMPDAKTIAAYQQADLILLNGAGYAKWVKSVSLPRSRLVNTSKSFTDSYIHIENVMTHSHGPGAEHAHTGTAFTTWIDFSQAAKQAEAILLVLNRKRPEAKSIFEKNYKKLKSELLALDDEMKKLVANNPTLPLVASHPVYQYFTRRYRVNMHSVMWEPEQPPSDAQWLEFESILKNHNARWMVWEGSPNSLSVSRLNAKGVSSVTINPSATQPVAGDFLSEMKKNVAEFKKVYLGSAD